MMNEIPVAVDPNRELISIVLSDDWIFSIHLTILPILIALAVIAVLVVFFRIWTGRRLTNFEIDSAELGLGDSKISFKPNDLDRQIAYSIWVELSTRKLGLPINIDDDVVIEIYDSWYSFFGITRELIKNIPVSKVRSDSTGKIIQLSIEVLNEGLRPHLTMWQSRFRHWFERQMDQKSDASPQDVQKKFPDYDALCADLLSVNNKLIMYREKMNELVRVK